MIGQFFRKDGLMDMIPESEGFDLAQQDRIIGEIRQEFILRKQRRRPFELQWELNIAFREGRQFLQLSPVGDRIQEIPQFLTYESRAVFNQIAPIIETRLAKLKRLTLDPDVRSATGEDDDVSKARIASKILKSTKRTINFDNVQNTVNEWSENTGTGIFKTYWNPSKGRKIYHDEETNVCKREGEIETIAVSPFELFPDSNYNPRVEDCRNIIQVKAYHVDDIYDIWGVRATPASINVFTLNNGNTVLNTGDLVLRKSNKVYNHALVYEYWEKPSSLYKNGRLIICTDEKILHYGDMPYKIGGEEGERGYPFTLQRCLEQANCFWGQCIIERLIPVQRRYNSIRNRVTEYLYRSAVGILTVQTGTRDIDLLEEEGLSPGQIIEYEKNTLPPQYLQMPPLPNQFNIELEQCINDFTRISGVSELSRTSQAPTGTSSGRAFAILAEQDDTRISLTADNIKMSSLDIFKKWLRLYKQYVKNTRVLRVIGESNLVDMQEWTNDSINSEDVVISTISSLSETPAQKKQFIIDILSMGLFNDPITGTLTKDVQLKILDALEIGDVAMITNDDTLQRKRAERENIELDKNLEHKVEDYDDHEEHIRVHINRMLSAEFEMKAKQDPELRVRYDSHVKEHINAMRGMVKNQEQVDEMAMQEQLNAEQEMLMAQENQGGF